MLFRSCYAQVAPLWCGADIAKLKLTSVGDLITFAKGAILQGQLHAFLLNVVDIVVVDIARGRDRQDRSVFTGLLWQVVPLRGNLRGTALAGVIGTQNWDLGLVQVEWQVHGRAIDTIGAADTAGGSIGDIFSIGLSVGA